MPEERQTDLAVIALTQEALRVCQELHEYTCRNSAVFTSDDEDRIAETIRSREPLINAVVGIENRLDMLTGGASPLPPEAEKIRGEIRTVLDEVTAMDCSSMGLLREKMQKYRDETLKLRNRKNLSAYMRTGVVRRSGTHCDWTK